MHKNVACKKLKKQLFEQFGSITAAAKHFKISRGNLSLIANGTCNGEIPAYLCRYAGIQKNEVTYSKLKGDDDGQS
jgi:hypothetical protein